MAVRNADSVDIRVPKAAELVASHLRRQIVQGQVSEGDLLPPESALMERFGVSRPTLREAFRILEWERLITVTRGSRGGAQVHAPNSETAARYMALVLEYEGVPLLDIYAARAVLEPPAAAAVAARRTKADLARLEECAASVADAFDTRSQAAAHTRFHHLVVQLAGNQTVELLSGMIEAVIERATRDHLDREPDEMRSQDVEDAQRAHLKLIEHIRDKDVEAAQSLWYAHLDEIARRLTKGQGQSGLHSRDDW